MQNEKDIVQHIKKNEFEKAVTAISNSYHEILYWHIRKIVKHHQDANDALQNSYIRMFRGIKSFKFKSSVKTWCFRIAYNEAIRLLQKKQSLQHTENKNDLNDYLGNLTADPYFDLDAASYAFHESLVKLSTKQQRIFQMKYFDELTFDEIADITEWNKNSIKTAFYTAKEKIIVHVKAAI